MKKNEKEVPVKLLQANKIKKYNDELKDYKLENFRE